MNRLFDLTRLNVGDTLYYVCRSAKDEGIQFSDASIVILSPKDIGCIVMVGAAKLMQFNRNTGVSINGVKSGLVIRTNSSKGVPVSVLEAYLHSLAEDPNPELEPETRQALQIQLRFTNCVES